MNIALDMDTSVKATHIREKANKVRLAEIEDDLDQTEFLWKQNRNKDFRTALNKLRYALIVEQHSITNPKADF